MGFFGIRIPVMFYQVGVEIGLGMEPCHEAMGPHPFNVREVATCGITCLGRPKICIGRTPRAFLNVTLNRWGPAQVRTGIILKGLTEGM